MTYTLPQVLVYQEYQAVPTPVTEPLRAHISGPNAQLFRYSEGSEKALAALGNYDPTTDKTYYWPNRPTGGIVDQSYVKLLMDDALLKYFSDPIGSGSTITPVAGTTNQIKSDAVVFKTTSSGNTTWHRDGDLYDRDVQIGDVVDVLATVGSTDYALRTTVSGFVGDTVAAVISSATADSSNAATQSATSSTTQTAGTSNNVSASESITNYNGLPDGYINETYTIKVIQGSTGGNLTTARLSVTSASGLDDVDSVAPAASGSPTTIGSRGLKVTWTTTGGDNMVVGQTWVVVVKQAFTAPAASSGGNYTLPYDTTYIIKVTRGGLYSSSTPPQISVTTTHGVDMSGPTNVTASGSGVPVGTGGVTVSFNATGLRKGDVYYIPVTAKSTGAVHTLVLADNLPASMRTASDLSLTLYIKKSGLEIAHERKSTPGAFNYELGTPGVLDTDFKVKAGIEAYDSSWTSSGVQLPLPVTEGKMYMQYRAWLPTVADKVYSISDTADLDDIPGALDPDNPLKWGVYCALQQANGTAVKYTAVTEPSDTTAWTNVIELITGRRDVYGLVPLTRDPTVLSLFQAHVQSQSSAPEDRWRVLWVSLDATETSPIVTSKTSADGNDVLATIKDDPNTSGTQYTLVEVPAGNGKFVTNGVKPNDIMRYNFSTDAWGNVTYDEYIIDAVINEDTLRLKTQQGTTENTVAKKLEIYRSLSNTELAEQIANKAAGYGSTRVRAVWPDKLTIGGKECAGYHLCATLAGLRSGVAPNQGLTNVEITGISDVSRTYDKFNKTQLDLMAGSGTWIVTKADDGAIITRHAVTSIGGSDPLTREEMVISNVDSMSFVFLSDLEDMIGRYNVTAATLDLIELRAQGTIEYFKEVRIARIGGQLSDGQVISVRQHSLFLDRAVLTVKLVVPAPLNNVEVHLSISAVSGLAT